MGLAVAAVVCGSCTTADSTATPITTTTVAPAESGTSGALSDGDSNPSTSTSTSQPAEISEEERARVNEELIQAAWGNDVALAEALINDGADVNYKDNTVQSAYLIATSEGYLDLLNLTLAHGADVQSLDSFNGTGLIRAAERGHAPIIGRLLQTEIDPNHVNNLGWTALHEAIIFGKDDQRYADTIRLLVAGGADVEIPTRRDDANSIELAESRGIASAELLRASAQAAPSEDAGAQLLNAATNGDADQAALAIRMGADLEVRDDKLRTPLLLAVTDDRLDVARLLVALGADPDALDDRHDTPWLVTGVTGSVGMLQILLPAQPDTSILNRFGGTSLIPASERGHLSYVQAAVNTTIDINHVNDLGWTALMEAVLFGNGSPTYQDIVETLLEAGADPSIADDEGVTAIEHAQARGHTEIARLLGG